MKDQRWIGNIVGLNSEFIFCEKYSKLLIYGAQLAVWRRHVQYMRAPAPVCTTKVSTTVLHTYADTVFIIFGMTHNNHQYHSSTYVCQHMTVSHVTCRVGLCRPTIFRLARPTVRRLKPSLVSGRPVPLKMLIFVFLCFLCHIEVAAFLFTGWRVIFVRRCHCHLLCINVVLTW